MSSKDMKQLILLSLAILPVFALSACSAKQPAASEDVTGSECFLLCTQAAGVCPDIAAETCEPVCLSLGEDGKTALSQARSCIALRQIPELDDLMP